MFCTDLYCLIIFPLAKIRKKDFGNAYILPYNMEKTSISIISLEFHKQPHEVSNVITNRDPRKLKFREAFCACLRQDGQ